MEPPRFRDVESIVASWLVQELPDLDVWGERPRDEDWQELSGTVAAIIFSTTSPFRAVVLDDRIFHVEVWDHDSVAAFDTAADVAQALARLPGHEHIYSTKASAPKPFPDDDAAGRARYLVTCEITARAAD